MERVQVVSRKFDGSLRDEYEAWLVQNTVDCAVVLSVPGQSYFDHRKQARFRGPDGVLELYPKSRWFNVWHIAEQISGQNRMYINIAKPAVVRDRSIEWVDLDLDYRVHLDWRIEKIDEEEFVENARRMRYSPELMADIIAACGQVEVGLRNRAYPFDHEAQVVIYRELIESLASSG